MNYGAIWGPEANDMDSDAKHMAVHLQVALAMFSGLEKNPCISNRTTLQRDLSKAAAAPLPQLVHSNESLGFNLNLSLD